MIGFVRNKGICNFCTNHDCPIEKSGAYAMRCNKFSLTIKFPKRWQTSSNKTGM